MTLATQYQEGSSQLIAPFVTSSDRSPKTTSCYKPNIYHFSAPKSAYGQRSKHTKFSSFLERRQKERPAEMRLAMTEISDALYHDEGATLKSLRMRSGLTQSQLADALETSQPQVARLESGRQDPAFSTCRKICKILGVTLEELGDALERQTLINEEKHQRD